MSTVDNQWWLPQTFSKGKHAAVLKTRPRMPAHWQMALISLLSLPFSSTADHREALEGLLWTSLIFVWLLSTLSSSLAADFKTLGIFCPASAEIFSLVPGNNWLSISSAMHIHIFSRTELNYPTIQMITRLIHHFLHWVYKQSLFVFSIS